MLLADLAARIGEEKLLPPEQDKEIDIQEETPQLEQKVAEPTSDDEVWLWRLIEILRQGEYPKHPLFVDGKYIIHDFRKCAKTHIRYYREAMGDIKPKNENEVVSKGRAMDGIKRLVELAEECETGISRLPHTHYPATPI